MCTSPRCGCSRRWRSCLRRSTGPRGKPPASSQRSVLVWPGRGGEGKVERHELWMQGTGGTLTFSCSRRFLLPQEDLRTAFLSYFKVGQPGGKTLKRFDELMQVRCAGHGMGREGIRLAGAASHLGNATLAARLAAHCGPCTASHARPALHTQPCSASLAQPPMHTQPCTPSCAQPAHTATRPPAAPPPPGHGRGPGKRPGGVEEGV